MKRLIWTCENCETERVWNAGVCMQSGCKGVKTMVESKSEKGRRMGLADKCCDPLGNTYVFLCALLFSSLKQTNKKTKKKDAKTF